MTYRTRGSSADREYYCAGCIGYDGPQHNSTSAEAIIGTAVHFALASHVVDIEIDIDAIAAETPDPATTRVAFFNGVKIWKAIRPAFPGALGEMKISGEVTKGTADVLSLTYDRAELKSIGINDWKLADSGDEHPKQLRAYAAAAVDKFGEPSDGHVTICESWLLDGEFRLERVTMGAIERFKTHMRKQHEQAGIQFAAGSWCRYCPARLVCEPREQYERSTAQAFLAKATTAMASREALAEAYDSVQLCRKLIREYDRATALALDDGPLALSGNRQLIWDEQQHTEFVDPNGALDFLRDIVDCGKVMRISKGAVESQIRERAPKGQGAGRVRVLMAQMESMGLTAKKTVKKRKVVKS